MIMIRTDHLFLFFLLQALIATTACTSNKYQRQSPHGAPVSPSTAADTVGDTDNGSPTAEKPLADGVATGAAALVPQVEAFLSQPRLEDARVLVQNETIKRLHRLNEAVIAVLESNTPPRVKGGSTADDDVSSHKAKLLSLYAAAIAKDCDGRLRGCTTLGFFKRSPGSARIAREIAEREPTIEGRYRFLALAYALTGRVRDPALDTAYLARAREYFDSLHGSTDPAAKAVAREHLERVVMILSSLVKSSDSPSDPDARIVTDFQPWNFDRARLSELERIEEMVLNLAVRDGLYVSRETGQLAPEFAARVKALAERDGGLLSHLKTIRNELPHFLKGLGLPETPVLDERFYVFENLYEGRMTLTDASHVWVGIRTDGESARGDLLTYARFRMAVLVAESARHMQQFFAAQGRFSSQTVLQKAVDEGAIIAGQWADGLRRLALLKTFNDRHLAEPSGESSKKIESFFAGLDRNVKTLSTYPNMMLIIYHLARMNFSMKLVTYRQVIDLKSSDIIKLYFSGRLEPFFKFSNDTAPLSKAEIFQTFQFALKTGVFSDRNPTIPDVSSSDADTSAVRFFRLMIDQVLANDRAEVERITVNLGRRFDGNADFISFRRQCELDRERRARGETRLPSPKTPLEALEHYTYMGLPQGARSDALATSAALESAWSLYDTDRLIDKNQAHELFERVRMDYSPKLDEMLLYASLLEAHLQDTEGEVAARSQMVEVREALAPFVNARRAFYGRLFAIHDQVSSCLDGMITTEFESQKNLLRAMSAHLREVHADMTKRQQTATTTTAATATSTATTAVDAAAADRGGRIGTFHLAKIRDLDFPGLAEHEAPLGVSADSYRFSKVQLLLRFKLALENGFTSERGQEPPIRETGAIALPSRIRELSPATRSQVLEVPYHPDREVFVANGLRAIFAAKSAPIQWLDLSGFPIPVYRRMRALAAMYKAGDVEVPDSAATSTDIKQRRLSPDELARTTLTMIRHFEVDAEWISFIHAIGRTSRYKNVIYFDDIAFRAGTGETLGLLDSMFSFIRQPSLGTGDLPTEKSDADTNHRQATAPRTNPLDEALNHFRTRRASGANAFELSLSTEFSSTIDRYQGERADRELGLQTEFVRAARAIENARDPLLPAWRLFVTRSLGDRIPVLSENLVRTLTDDAREFERGTKRAFRAELLP